jgi:hypothetical protein
MYSNQEPHHTPYPLDSPPLSTFKESRPHATSAPMRSWRTRERPHLSRPGSPLGSRFAEGLPVSREGFPDGLRATKSTSGRASVECVFVGSEIHSALKQGLGRSTPECTSARPQGDILAPPVIRAPARFRTRPPASSALPDASIGGNLDSPPPRSHPEPPARISTVQPPAGCNVCPQPPLGSRREFRGQPFAAELLWRWVNHEENQRPRRALPGFSGSSSRRLHQVRRRRQSV